MTDLKCDMLKECTSTISHIDEKGYIYCKFHGENRKHSMKCRKLTIKEVETLKTGKPIKKY